MTSRDEPQRELDCPATRPASLDHQHADGQPSVTICVDNLHKSFGANHVLRGINLEVHRGEMLAIVGGSGSGKTVLLENIIGHLTPERGRVLIADFESQGAPLVDITQLDDQEMDRIRLHWAVVFQRNALFSGTVYENIALWLREVKRLEERNIRPIALDALRAVGFDNPESVIDQNRDELSGGMAKRVAVARAIAMDPEMMFYDEPTTGLDPTLSRQIHDLVQSTHVNKPGQTTLIITHDKDLLYRLEPRIIMLHEGKVFFDGAYEDFKASRSEIIRPYFDLMPGLHRRHIEDI